METTDLAYAAGLIDGEGCIHLGCRKGTYRARVTVGMTEPALPLLRWLQATWGGSVVCSRAATERWAAAWTWNLMGIQAAAFLEQVEPFLRMKAEQSRLAREVEWIRANLPRRPNGSGSWTDSARAECAVIKSRMHDLNAKGPRVPAPTVEAA